MPDDLTSYHKERYGAWAWIASGRPADPLRCAEEIKSKFVRHQCTRRRGHGPESAFCKQHAKMWEKQHDR